VTDILNHFRSTEPPSSPENEDFGVKLPNELSFPLTVGNRATKDIMFVRKCYSTLIRIVETELSGGMSRGVIFTGPQGNGKVSFV
jgi:hypothetical protein